MLYAPLEMFLNIVSSGLEPKNLIITAVVIKTSKFVSLAVMCKFSQTYSGEVIYKLKFNRDSLCSLKSVVN